MKEKPATGIQTLKDDRREKRDEIVTAIKNGIIFEKTKKIYLEMKALKESLANRLNNAL